MASSWDGPAAGCSRRAPLRRSRSRDRRRPPRGTLAPHPDRRRGSSARHRGRATCRRRALPAAKPPPTWAAPGPIPPSARSASPLRVVLPVTGAPRAMPRHRLRAPRRIGASARARGRAPGTGSDRPRGGVCQAQRLRHVPTRDHRRAPGRARAVDGRADRRDATPTGSAARRRLRPHGAAGREPGRGRRRSAVRSRPRIPRREPPRRRRRRAW